MNIMELHNPMGSRRLGRGCARIRVVLARKAYCSAQCAPQASGTAEPKTAGVLTIAVPLGGGALVAGLLFYFGAPPLCPTLQASAP